MSVDAVAKKKSAKLREPNPYVRFSEAVSKESTAPPIHLVVKNNDSHFNMLKEKGAEWNDSISKRLKTTF